MTVRQKAWTKEQHSAMRELSELHKAHPDKIVELNAPYSSEKYVSGLAVDLTLSMGQIARPLDDVLLNCDEPICLTVLPTYPMRPPKVHVPHTRFSDLPHVLNGRELCIFLNEDREWYPSCGIARTLERTWEFLEDAANGRLDSDAALFHAVGGYNPATPGAGTAVVRSFPGLPGKPWSISNVRWRTPARLDIGPEGAFNNAPSVRALTITVPCRLPLGTGRTLGEVLTNVEGAGGPDAETVMDALRCVASTLRPGQPIVLTLAVSRDKVPDAGWHLCTARVAWLPVSKGRVVGPTVAEINTALEPGAVLQWLDMSDHRPELAVRRDINRPIHALAGLDVEVWGCGALGSWIAEWLVRAGVARVRLIDPRGVNAGLLVRQNYRECDVGLPKATQLKIRLEEISDYVVVETRCGSPTFPYDSVRDVIIDATVNEAVAALARPPQSGTILASVATDVDSASLGLLVVGSSIHTPAEVQSCLSKEVRKRGDLEPFHRLWEEVEPGDMVLPSPGCSTPTFHGSAADAAGVAAVMVNLLSSHLTIESEMPGLHLINMPHSGTKAPGHTFLEMETVE